jgi:hypothetical protein
MSRFVAALFLCLIITSANASVIFPTDSRIRKEVRDFVTQTIQERCPKTFSEQNFFAVKIAAEVDEDFSFYEITLVGINAAGAIVNSVVIGLEEYSGAGFEIAEFGIGNCR